MTLKQVLSHFKTKAELARQLDISPQAVNDWGELIPRTRQFQIQVITKGKLKADPKAKKTRKTKAA